MLVFFQKSSFKKINKINNINLNIDYYHFYLPGNWKRNFKNIFFVYLFSSMKEWFTFDILMIEIFLLEFSKTTPFRWFPSFFNGPVKSRSQSVIHYTLYVLLFVCWEKNGLVWNSQFECLFPCLMFTFMVDVILQSKQQTNMKYCIFSS